MPKIWVLFGSLVFASGAIAETNVVLLDEDVHVRPQSIRLFVKDEKLWLDCEDKKNRDNVWIKVNVDELVAGLTKILEWMELNRTVMADIEKHIDLYGDSNANGNTVWGRLTFSGVKSGNSIVFIGRSTVLCFLDKSEIEKLVFSLKNDVERAYAEDANNKAKESLFQ